VRSVIKRVSVVVVLEVRELLTNPRATNTRNISINKPKTLLFLSSPKKND
jgi:hypothetical protein